MRSLISSCLFLAACGSTLPDNPDASVADAPADVAIDAAIDAEIDAPDSAVPPDPLAIGLILPFDGACPAGFTERTDLANRYLRGHDGDATFAETGGAATHTHDIAAHTHVVTMAGTSHTHQVTFGNTTQTTIATPGGTLPGSGVTHTHTATSSAAGGPHSHAIITKVLFATGTAPNDPLFREVVLCEVTGAVTLLPTTAIALEPSACATDWTAAASTAGRLLRAHDLDGNLAEVGGSEMHSHTMVHDHTATTQSGGDHTHTATAGAPSVVLDDLVPGTASSASGSHAHAITMSGTHFHTLSGYAGSTTATSSMPEYRELLACHPTTPALLPADALALSMTACPTGWIEVIEFRNRFLGGDDGDATPSEIIGGPHTHVATHDHGMTGASDHNHAATGGASTGTVAMRNSNTRLVSADGHTHTVSIGSADLHAHPTQATSPAVTSVDALPPFIEVVVCKRQ